MTLKWPKMTQQGKNDPTWQKVPNMAKMTQHGKKWPEMFRQMVQMRQGIPTPNYMT